MTEKFYDKIWDEAVSFAKGQIKFTGKLAGPTFLAYRGTECFKFEMPGWGGSDFIKHRILDGIWNYFKEEKIDTYIYMTEGWAANLPLESPIAHKASLAPNRREVILVAMINASGPIKSVSREVVKVWKKGRLRVELKKLNDIPDGETTFSGTYSDLLEPGNRQVIMDRKMFEKYVKVEKITGLGN